MLQLFPNLLWRRSVILQINTDVVPSTSVLPASPRVATSYLGTPAEDSTERLSTETSPLATFVLK